MIHSLNMKIDRNHAIVEALLAVIIWGASFVATKFALRYTSPDAVVWMRFSVGVVILGIGAFGRRQVTLPRPGEWFYFALLGFLGITFHQWLQSTGLVTSQATTTSWIVSTIPIFMAILAWLFLKERLIWWQAAGIVISTVGVLVVVARGNLGLLALGKFGTVGDFLVLISALNWAVFSILSRRGLRKYPAIMMMFYVMAFGWIFSSILFFFSGGFGQLHPILWDGWLAIGFLGIFCSGLAYIFWYDALQSLPVAQTGAFLYIEPIVTVFVAAIVIGEKLTLSTMLGGLMILTGVWLVNRNNLRQS
jgi:drug/metabolite transporter (DMT)-like permease